MPNDRNPRKPTPGRSGSKKPRAKKSGLNKSSSKKSGAFKPSVRVNPDGEIPVVHLYVLLDRSGSMGTIADDVIGGFNHLLAEQQADGADARITLVQFDTQDPHEVIADAVPVLEMVLLDASTFVPRGGTPLLDATGLLLSRAAKRESELAATNQTAEEIVFMSVTDGHENASCELDLATVRKLVEQHTQKGWTFVFLSAALDVYGEAGGLGHDARSTQAFVQDRDGAAAAFQSLSRATTSRRAKVRTRQTFDKDDYFEGQKPAEDDRERRQR